MQKSLFLCFIALFSFLILEAAEPRENNRFKADSTWGQWNMRLAPYIWIPALRGEVIKPPKPTQLPIPPPPKFEIDISMKEFRHSLKFAFMLSGQVKKGFLVTQFNVSSFILESQAITPYEIILHNNLVNLAYVGGDWGIGYRIFRLEKFEWDILAGMKYVYARVGLSTELLGHFSLYIKRDHWWLEPVISTNLLYNPHPRVEVAALGDVGPNWPDPNLTYQLYGHVNFLITRHIFTSLGYRHYYVNHPHDEAVYNGSMSGLFIKLGAQF